MCVQVNDPLSLITQYGDIKYINLPLSNSTPKAATLLSSQDKKMSAHHHHHHHHHNQSVCNNAHGHDVIVGPPWLEPLLHTNFFMPCSIHGDSSKNECNQYCLDCMGSAFCLSCLPSHRDHHIIQVCIKKRKEKLPPFFYYHYAQPHYNNIRLYFHSLQCVF